MKRPHGSNQIAPVALMLALGLLCSGASIAHAAWRHFRGTARQAGLATGKLSGKLKLAWRFKTNGPIFSSPVVDGGRVFIGSQDGYVYALNQQTGAKIWSFKTGGLIEAAPVVVGGLLAIGSDDGYLYGLEAANGTLRWKYETEDKIMGAATAVTAPDGKNVWLVVGSYDSRVHCVNASTGKRIWVFETDNYVNGSPAVANGKVIFGGCDGTLYVVRLADGKMDQEILIGDFIAGSAGIDGNMAYLGHYGNRVVAANIVTGKIVWTYRNRGFAYFSSPAIASDRIVIGGRDKRLHCISRRTGKAIWEFRTRGRVDSSPVICDAKVIVGSEDGRVYMVGLADGRELWSYEIGAAVRSTPAVSDGMVFIGADDGYVYAFRGA